MTLHAKMAYANMMRSGLTASTPLTKPFCAGSGAQQLRRRPLTTAAFRRQFAVMAQATYDIWVKGSPEKNELGDCESSTHFLFCNAAFPIRYMCSHRARRVSRTDNRLTTVLYSLYPGPFSHRMMMTMEEKGISYHKNLLDEQKMPDW